MKRNRKCLEAAVLPRQFTWCVSNLSFLSGRASLQKVAVRMERGESPGVLISNALAKTPHKWKLGLCLFILSVCSCQAFNFSGQKISM